MRQKVEKLEKGNWYCDMQTNEIVSPTFLKYSHSENGIDCYSELKGNHCYYVSNDGFIRFTSGMLYKYIPTAKDIEKYNLNETEDDTTT